MTYEIHLRLLSDATFGRGDGVAGLVDAEVEHDPETGFPFMRGRTLKGLLVEECANLLYALGQGHRGHAGELTPFHDAARFLFGQGGSRMEDDARMRVGAARLPEDLQRALRDDLKNKRLDGREVLEALTSIRRQTAVEEETGIPDEGSLRSMRVLLCGTELVATLEFVTDPDDLSIGLLAACAFSIRRAGTGRNRGRGRLAASLRFNDGSGSPPGVQEKYRAFRDAVASLTVGEASIA
jgi:hypothetical protein